MPNIKPVSDLRNYTEVLKEVDVSNRVYLTRNGHGQYGILTMAEIDELDRYKAAYTLFSRLKNAEERAGREGWISADDSIYIVDIFHEREDFMWKLFGIRTTSQKTEDYWNE